jgi:hypothetical protein
MRQSLLALLMTVLVAWQAIADSTTEFEKIVASCKASHQNALRCERAVWKFADITRDDSLSIAELSRMTRLLGESIDRQNAKTSQKSDSSGILTALLLGPSAADLLMRHFDYNDDRKVSRKELHADLPEGKFTAFVKNISESGKMSFDVATDSIFGLWAKSTLGLSNISKNSGKPEKVKNPPPPEKPLELVDWSLGYSKGEYGGTYEIYYVLKKQTGERREVGRGHYSVQRPSWRKNFFGSS